MGNLRAERSVWKSDDSPDKFENKFQFSFVYLAINKV